MTGVLFALLITLLSGYFVVSIIDREMELRFRLLFSIPMGFAVSSVFYFLYQCLNLYNFQDFKWFELIAVIILALVYFNHEKPEMAKHKFKKLSNWFYVVNIYALAIFLKYFINNPMGSWDGFRIWNIKAEFLYLQSPLWKNVFHLPHFMSHCDYPLFLPASVARLWQYAGHQWFWANLAMGLLFTFGLVYLLYQAICYFKSEKAAVVVCTVFMISDIFLVNGAAQCADIPLAMFFLSSIVCLFFYFKNKRFTTFLLSIIFAGASVWVKNEGLMFLAVYTLVMLCWFVANKRNKKTLITAAIAAIFAACAILYKKFAGAPNDLVYGFLEVKSYTFAFDLHRYLVVLQTFLTLMFGKFVLFLSLAILAIKGFKIKEKFKNSFALSLAILLFMIAGYLAVYILSPHDINWLTENSMERIILQILPVFVFLFSITLRIGKPDSIN